MSTEADAWPAASLADARERLLVEFIRSLVDGRPLVVLGPQGEAPPPGLPTPAASGPPSVDGPLSAIEPGASAVLWLDAEPQHGRDDAVLRVLAEAATAGSPVVVVCAIGVDVATVALLADRLPDSQILDQGVAEVAVLGLADQDVAVTLAAEQTAHAGRIVCAGVRSEPPAAALSVASEVRDEQLRALEAANAALREANVRLAREHLGRYDSAAASVVHRLDVAQQRFEQEREIALENDRLFQETRRRLQQPHHRAADRLVRILKGMPGGAALVRLLKRGAGG